MCTDPPGTGRGGRVLVGLAVRIAACAAVLAPAVACTSDDDGSVSPVPGADVPVEQVVAEHGDAVWRVETEGCGWTGVGSAFAIDPHRLVTNNHVIASDTSPLVRSRTGETRQGRVIGADPERDVAVIEVDEPMPATVPWAQTSSLRETERLVVIGYPRPDHAFTVSYGSLVAFAGPERAEDLVVSNAPIDRGNSGGPALRGDGSVVGVVTRVLLDDPGEAMAIVHTTDRVIDTVVEAIERPRDVLSDCGLGPDYVPPLPEGVEIAEPPPPPTPDVTATTRETGRRQGADERADKEPDVTSTTWRAPDDAGPDVQAPSTATSVGPCPGGGVEPVVTERTVHQDDDGSRVDVRGTVTNRASEAVVVESVRVTFEGEEPVVVEVAPGQADLEPSGTTSWEVSAIVAGATEDQPLPEVVARWRWRADGLDHCPAGGSADDR